MKIVIIGGGPAGMMAAITAAKAGADVVLLEKNEKTGKKLFITGKGRCNVTNACDTENLFANVMEHSKFLYSAVYGYDNQAVMQFFEDAGCHLKTERGQRVFPESDHSSDILRALDRKMQKAGVKVRLNSEVEEVLIDNEKKQILGVRLHNREKIMADRLIIATGGISYVLTGSTGDGYRFAREAGHSVTKLSPALVPFNIEEDWCKQLQGLSLRNVEATIEVEGRNIYSDFGEMLFTHYGVSGPLMLSGSSYYVHKAGNRPAKLYIDLKPALTQEQLDKRILREFDANRNKQFKNAIATLFPAKMQNIMPMLAQIDPEKKVNEITKEERERFLHTIKHLELTITGVRDYNEAIITKGGVKLSEINPSTMESKIIKGLYFAGEVLDLDALTGGYNLQIAWSTGHLAGESAAEE